MRLEGTAFIGPNGLKNVKIPQLKSCPLPADFKASKRLRKKQILNKHTYLVFGLNPSFLPDTVYTFARAWFFPLIRKRKISMNSYKQRILAAFSTPSCIVGEIGVFHLTSSPPCWCTEQIKETLSRKTWTIIGYCFVHQHGRLIMWLKTIYKCN